MTDASEALRGFLATVGSPYTRVRPDAPPDATARTAVRVPQADAWNRLEHWYGVLPEVTPLRVRVAMPFVNQVRDGFAVECRIEVGGLVPEPSLASSALVAEIALERPVQNVVTLPTPEPLTPRAIRGAADDRRLGLAIRVHPWAPRQEA